LTNRDEKVAALVDDNAKLREEVTKLKYQLKELK
jgi:cell division protein FtsB